MGQHFIPRNEGEKLSWLSNYRDKIAAYGGGLGLERDETAAIRDEIDAFLAACDDLLRLKKSLHAETACLREQERALREKLEAQVVRLKSGTGYLSQIGRQLRIEGEISSFDPDAFKPGFNLMAEAGCVRVDFAKGELDAVNIYSRVRGQPAWRFVARDTNSPYMDCSPPSGADPVEVREYMLRGVLGDEEVGCASDVITVSCGESIRSAGSGPAKRVGRWA